MDAERASSDDLDVQLEWPDAEPYPPDVADKRHPNSVRPKSTRQTLGARASGSATGPPDIPESQNVPTDSIRSMLALVSDGLEGITHTLRLLAEQQVRIEQTLREIETLRSQWIEQIGPRGQGEDVAAALTRVAEQLEALRRRITLRGKAEHFSSDEMVELIAGAIIERLRRSSEDIDPPIRRRRGR